MQIRVKFLWRIFGHKNITQLLNKDWNPSNIKHRDQCELYIHLKQDEWKQESSFFSSPLLPVQDHGWLEPSHTAQGARREPALDRARHTHSVGQVLFSSMLNEVTLFEDLLYSEASSLIVVIRSKGGRERATILPDPAWESQRCRAWPCPPAPRQVHWSQGGMLSVCVNNDVSLGFVPLNSCSLLVRIVVILVSF